MPEKFETNHFSNYKTIESSKGSISTYEQNGFCRRWTRKSPWLYPYHEKTIFRMVP